MSLNIKEEKIIYNMANHACKVLNLSLFDMIEDSVGVRAIILQDKQKRKYYMVAKRYVAVINNRPIVSINKEIVKKCNLENYYIVMVIKDGMYVYTFNPREIMDHGWENIFNRQVMINFPIQMAKNMELTRTRKERVIENSTLNKYIVGE